MSTDSLAAELVNSIRNSVRIDDIYKIQIGWRDDFMQSKEHDLDECVLVFLNNYLKEQDTIWESDEICEQGYADFKLNGINSVIVKRIMRNK